MFNFFVPDNNIFVKNHSFIVEQNFDVKIGVKFCFAIYLHGFFALVEVMRGAVGAAADMDVELGAGEALRLRRRHLVDAHVRHQHDHQQQRERRQHHAQKEARRDHVFNLPDKCQILRIN